MPTGIYQHKITQGMFGKKHNEGTKKKIKEKNKGKHYSRKTEFKKGQTSWNKGKKLGKGFYPERSYDNLKPYQYRKGKKHPKWKGGVCRNKHYLGRKEYREWRMKVFIRDNFTCQFCGTRSHLGLGKKVELEAHHIKSWKKYPKLRFDVDNGITLCKECHNLTKV